jgi:uncharacterized protein YcsI (UPF0317 family)
MRFTEPAQLRRAVRRGSFHSPTCGEAPGYVQTNVAALPSDVAEEFALFVDRNPSACPLLEVITGGAESLMAAGSDLSTDVPRYRVFRDSQPPFDTTDARPYWLDDFVTFLLGCSFTFDSVLAAAGFGVRHVELGVNVPMFITNIACSPTVRFRGPLVVSMRPFKSTDIAGVTELTASRPLLHGAPLHIGNPTDIGIANLDRPDFGDPVSVEMSEVPVFWACGVTPQLAIASANLEIAVTHAPGHMFVTDVREVDIDDWPRPTGTHRSR